MAYRIKIAEDDQLIDGRLGNVKQILNDRLARKVIDWVFKNRVDRGEIAEFHWEPEDKELLQKICKKLKPKIGALKKTKKRLLKKT